MTARALILGLVAAALGGAAPAPVHLRCQLEDAGNLDPAVAAAEIDQVFRIDPQGFWARWDAEAGAWAAGGCERPALVACAVRPLYFERRELRPDGASATTRIDRAGGRIVHVVDASSAYEPWRGLKDGRAWGRCDPVPPPAPGPRRF